MNTMYEVKVRGGTYSKFYDKNNLTYKVSRAVSLGALARVK